jgi:hypothetical protein
VSFAVGGPWASVAAAGALVLAHFATLARLIGQLTSDSAGSALGLMARAPTSLLVAWLCVSVFGAEATLLALLLIPGGGVLTALVSWLQAQELSAVVRAGGQVPC